MTKLPKTIIIISIPAVILIIAGIWLWQTPPQSNKDSATTHTNTKSTYIIPVDYNWQIFAGAIHAYPKTANANHGNVVGAIVPHHDLAGHYTAELFQKISDDQITTIILIGPNHTDGGVGEAISGIAQWNTKIGSVETNNTIANKLYTAQLVTWDENRLRTEHSINYLIPYIKYYFPNARIVPIILKSTFDLASAKNFGESLKPYLDDQTLIVGSIDFSHYLPTDRARANDQITQKALENHDYKKLYSFNNDYIDSPPTAITTLMATAGAGATQVEIVRNQNQADVAGVPTVDSSTSYFTILLRMPGEQK